LRRKFILSPFLLESNPWHIIAASQTRALLGFSKTADSLRPALSIIISGYCLKAFMSGSNFRL
jgi:hypothetical protein